MCWSPIGWRLLHKYKLYQRQSLSIYSIIVNIATLDGVDLKKYSNWLQTIKKLVKVMKKRKIILKYNAPKNLIIEVKRRTQLYMSRYWEPISLSQKNHVWKNPFRTFLPKIMRPWTIVWLNMHPKQGPIVPVWHLLIELWSQSALATWMFPYSGHEYLWTLVYLWTRKPNYV